MSILAARLVEAMADRNVDQSELARRLGVTQGAISKILLGKTARSRLIPRIAAELGVSIAWLAGEEDLSWAGASISHEDREWLELLHRLPPSYRAGLIQLGRIIAEGAQVGGSV